MDPVPDQSHSEIPSHKISIVVPVLDEVENLPLLHGEILTHVGAMGCSWEVIYVDDFSTDGSRQVLRQLHAADPEHVRLIFFRRNFGQTSAMAAGFELSRGEIVVTLDADLQNDPADVPHLVSELEQGFDLVVGWRRDRQDGMMLRRAPSILANLLIRRVSGSGIHDTGCTLKAFRRTLVERMPIYAEQHRFLPALAMGSGARIGELVVNHRPRIHGTSKYGIGRAARVLSDLLSVQLVGSFVRSPLIYFALCTVPFVLATLMFVTMIAWSDERVSFSNQWGQAALLIMSLFVMTIVDFLLFGLLAELVVRASNVFGRGTLAPLVEEGTV
ncbi:MAG TPA: glycosyltransferase [Planctomycetes bacterium]|nr:glycosyltransferase [Planctomycetota bacterium]HIL36935.1 glycosyltransferase [Planctomycetota bacterium]